MFILAAGCCCCDTCDDCPSEHCHKPHYYDMSWLSGLTGKRHPPARPQLLPLPAQPVYAPYDWRPNEAPAVWPNESLQLASPKENIAWHEEPAERKEEPGEESTPVIPDELEPAPVHALPVAVDGSALRFVPSREERASLIKEAEAAALPDASPARHSEE